MSQPDVDHYGAQYSNFAGALYAEVRRAVFGEDIGQNGWITADEQDRIAAETGCSVDGVDVEARRAELRPIEGEADFDGQQVFFRIAAKLAEERRLSRIAYLDIKTP